MLIAAMVVASSVQSAASATVVFDKHHHPSILLRKGGKTYKLEEQPLGGHGGDYLGREHLDFKGNRFEPSGNRIRNSKTGQSVELQSVKPPWDGILFRFKGAMSLGDRMLWVYAWDSPEVSLEPSGKVEAYEITFRDGKLNVVRQAELPGAVGYAWGIAAKRYGNSVLFQVGDRISTFDIHRWREVGSTPNGSTIAPSGQAYWWTDGTLKAWNPKSNGWKDLRKDDCGPILAAYPAAGDDLLHCSEHWILARRGTRLEFPAGYSETKPENCQMFVAPKVGIGFFRSTIEGGRKGYVFDPHDLKPIAPVNYLPPKHPRAPKRP